MPTSPAPNSRQALPEGRPGRSADVGDIAVSVAPTPPRIPEGEYTARSTDVEVVSMFKGRKLWLTLEILGGPYDGTTLLWFAPLPEKGKPPRRRSTGFSSKFGRAWEMAANRRARHGERLSARMLVGKIYRIRVRTVPQDSRQRPLPEVSQYSVASDLLRRDEGGSS